MTLKCRSRSPKLNVHICLTQTSFPPSLMNFQAIVFERDHGQDFCVKNALCNAVTLKCRSRSPKVHVHIYRTQTSFPWSLMKFQATVSEKECGQDFLVKNASCNAVTLKCRSRSPKVDVHIYPTQTSSPPSLMKFQSIVPKKPRGQSWPDNDDDNDNYADGRRRHKWNNMSLPTGGVDIMNVHICHTQT